MNLFAKFSRRCRTDGLLASSDAILLAVSGGVDSLVMLDLFVELSKRNGQKLSVAHIDHQLRPESGDDAKFVQSLADAKRLPFFSEKIATREYAREHKLSLEMAGRVLRYEALERLRLRAKAGLVATAHTRSDQAETVLYRLLRGAGLAGLAGISERRGNLVRPLLSFSRADILNYAQARKLNWREDASNMDLSIPRNRLRHEAIPALAKHFNPELEAALSRTAKIAGEAHAYMKANAEAALLKVVKEQSPERIVLDIEQINEYNRLTHAYILRQAWERVANVGAPPSYRQIERALKFMSSAPIGARQSLGTEVELLLDRDGLVIEKLASRSFIAEVELNVPMKLPGAHRRLLVAKEAWRGEGPLAAANADSEYVDAAAVKGRLRVRWPQAGDGFYPLGMQQPKKLHDFFADLKLPIRQRASTPLLECESGIVWVCGFRIDERFKVTAATKEVLRLRLIE